MSSTTFLPFQVSILIGLVSLSSWNSWVGMTDALICPNSVSTFGLKQVPRTRMPILHVMNNSNNNSNNNNNNYVKRTTSYNTAGRPSGAGTGAGTSTSGGGTFRSTTGTNNYSRPPFGSMNRSSSSSTSTATATSSANKSSGANYNRMNKNLKLKNVTDPNRPPLNDEIKFDTLRVMITGKVTDVNKIPKDEPLGIMSKTEALVRAKEMGNFDVILINEHSDPPVVKIADYSKYRYEKEKKAKELKKNSKSTELKEIKMSYSIDTHDYEVRVKNASKFILQGNRVKCSILFKGREIQHDALGYELLNQMAEDMKKICIMEGKPKREGKILSSILCPKPDVVKSVNDKKRAEEKAKKKKKAEGKKIAAAGTSDTTGSSDGISKENMQIMSSMLAGGALIGLSPDDLLDLDADDDEEDDNDDEDEEDGDEDMDEEDDSLIMNTEDAVTDDDEDVSINATLSDDEDDDDDVSLDSLLGSDKVTDDLFS